MAALPVLFLHTGRFFVFCARRGDALHHRRSAPPCQISPWSVQKCGRTVPKTLKNGILPIVPKGQLYSYKILTKFTGFMRVRSLHNHAKFDWFSLRNDKIINNLPRWGRFQPNSRRPLAAKLLMEPIKRLGVKWWHEPPLLSFKIWWWRESTECDVFHFLCL